MPEIQKIPLIAESSDQTLSIDLDGNPYIIQVVWNDRFGYFSLNISTADEEVILQAVKMVKDYPLISSFSDTRLPAGDLYFSAENGVIERPGYDDLSVSFGLFYISPDAPVQVPVTFDTSINDVIGSVWDDGFSTWDDGDSLWDK